MPHPAARLLPLVLVTALVAPAPSVAAPPVPAGLQAPARTRVGRAWQSARLNLRQAARQVRQISGQRSLTGWARARKAARAVAGSLGLRRPGPVLLYQGAFDPVHTGHLTNLRSALGGLEGVREVYVVPTTSHPGKHPVPHAHRVAMMKEALAGAGLPRGVKVTVVDDARISRLSAGGFEDLTARIHADHPGSSLYIMTGADAYVRAAQQGLVPTARRWGYRYAVTPRAGHGLPSRLPVGVEVMPLSGGAQSSTRIRAALARGQGAAAVGAGLLPSTLRYVAGHRLYGAGPREGGP